MKIALISLHTPTPENKSGASALPYHLINHRSDGIEIRIYSYNLNGLSDKEISTISKNLNVSIKLLKVNGLVKFLRKPVGKILRFCMKFPFLHYLNLPKEIINNINNWASDLWIYGEDISHFARLFNKRCVVTTPDCEALYYKRILEMPSKIKSFKDIVRYGRAYSQYLNDTREWPEKNCMYHLVGMDDNDFLKKINPTLDTIFIPHPHYEGNLNREISFNKNKIKLLLPGRYDFYTKEAVDEVIEALCKHTDLAKYYDITFLGKNWESCVLKLRIAGYDVNSKGFVPIYKDELCDYDIQLSPISLGTGTKGKVLDAFINGLLVIGPIRAIENILVENKRDYLYYDNINTLLNLLKEIPKNVSRYEEIANHGRKTVCNLHSPSIIANKFFLLFDPN